jgi:DNA modification methylase
MSLPAHSQTIQSVMTTNLGRLTMGDAGEFLQELPAQSARLILASVWFTGPYDISSSDPVCPRFGLWLDRFIREFERVLLPDGSVVLEMGCTWANDRPVRTVQNYSAIAGLLDRGWHLLQEFYWYNPDLLRTPDEWVRHRRVRLHDSVSTWYWLARKPEVPADTRKVRNFQTSLTHRTGNLLTMGDHEVDEAYLDDCAASGATPHPDRLPVALPLYFINLLTSEGDHVVDPFVGTGSTALAAEMTGRAWSCNDFSAEVIDVAKKRLNSLRSGPSALKGSSHA